MLSKVLNYLSQAIDSWFVNGAEVHFRCLKWTTISTRRNIRHQCTPGLQYKTQAQQYSQGHSRSSRGHWWRNECYCRRTYAGSFMWL